MPRCETADISYLDQAPCKVVNVVDLPATPEAVFAIFEDEHAWPKWFGVLTKVEWTSPKPYGVGTTRTVTINGILKAKEHFFHWEDNRGFSFYFTETSLPFVKALVEDYQLEPIDANTTRLTYTVAYEPAFPLSFSGPLGKAFLARSFKKASESLVDYVRKHA